MTPEEKASILRDRGLCDHCLGRQFARLGHGLENWERGLIVRDHDARGEDLEDDAFVRENIPEEEPRREECSLCNGLFADLGTHIDRVLHALERYDFNTFLVGSRPPQEVVRAEEELWEEAGVEWVEPLKSELNRLIGKRIEAETEAVVDFERADVNPIYDVAKERVELQVNSLLVHGRYNKYSRELPQTKWPCGNCRGKGCDECDWTGKQYQESVQELIAGPFLEATKAVDTKFHGAGREDVDARCLGKREFVLEVLEPRSRDLDLAALQERINEEHGEKIEVFGLRSAEKDEVEAVKSRRADKTYRALVELSTPVDEELLDRLAELEGTVAQATPTRVEHRRADKTRERDVHTVSWERVDDTHIELEVKAAAGTYIKELISGDAEKTTPSVSQLLGVEAECVELDVIAIDA